MALVSIVLLSCMVSNARAEGRSVKAEMQVDTSVDYCEMVHELAKSEAAVLLGPRLGVQAFRYPPWGIQAGAEATGRDTQVRVYLDYSLVNAVRGKRTLDLADSKCQQRRASQPVEEAVRLSTNQGRRAALADQVAFLSDHKSEIARIERDAEARLQHHVITLTQLSEIRALVFELRRIALDADDTLGKMEAAAVPEPIGPLVSAVNRYDQATMAAERIEAGVRRLAAWNFSVRGGLTGQEAVSASRSVGWFAVVEASYNLGGLIASGAERRYLAARSRELESSSHELGPAARLVDRVLAESTIHLRRQIAELEELARQMHGDSVLVENSSTPHQPHLRAVLRLRQLSIESHLVYLRELARQRRAWENRNEH